MPICFNTPTSTTDLNTPPACTTIPILRRSADADPGNDSTNINTGKQRIAESGARTRR
ncbi:MAG: hypothetical protein IPM81_12935 [Saprospirales bacterium]|nr:hypothetical protein [Saprospirales bacterium]